MFVRNIKVFVRNRKVFVRNRKVFVRNRKVLYEIERAPYIETNFHEIQCGAYFFTEVVE
jgi:hypothetical protein